MKMDRNIDLNTINLNNVGSLVQEMNKEPPKGSILLDKYLLPSRGKYYNENIYISKLKTLDIKNLATIDEKNINIIINNVLKNCLWGIDYNKILLGDKVWLVFYLRSITYEDLPYNLKGTCENCSTIGIFPYTLNKLQIQYLPDNINDNIELFNKDIITIRFPTISTESAMNRLKNDENVMMEINPELLELSSYIFKVNNEELSLLKAYKYLINMDAMDFSKFTNEMTNYIFHAKPYAKFQCNTCGEDIIIPMSFAPSFFLPKIS